MHPLLWAAPYQPGVLQLGLLIPLAAADCAQVRLPQLLAVCETCVNIDRIRFMRMVWL
jgi:hypothetical protein